MKKILNLAKILRKNSSKISAKTQSDETSINLLAVLAPYLLPIIVSIASGIGFFLIKTYFPFAISEANVLALLLNSISIILVLFTFLKIINGLYLADDLDSILAMPYTQFQITSAKVITVVTNQFIMSAGYCLAGAIGYSLASPVSANFWIGVVLGLILIPTFTIAVVGSIVMLLMRFVSFARNKNLLRIVGAVIAIVALAGLYIYIYSGGSNSSELSNKFAEAFNIMNSLKGIASYIFPVAGLVISFCTSLSALNIALAIAITAVAVGIFVVVSKYTYLQGALAMISSSKSARALTNAEINKQSKKSGIIKTLTIKELKSALRNSQHLLQTVLMPVFMPIIMLIVLALSSKEYILPLLKDGMTSGFLIVVAFCSVLAFASSSSYNIASIAFSLEKDDFKFTKFLPIPYEHHARAKRNASLIFQSIGAILPAMLIGIVLSAMGMMPYYLLPFIPAYMVPLLIIGTDYMIYADSRKPKFEWDTLNTIRSYNVSALIVVLIDFAVVAVAVTGGIIMRLAFDFRLAGLVVTTAVIIILIAVAVIVNKKAVNGVAKNLEKINM